MASSRQHQLAAPCAPQQRKRGRTAAAAADGGGSQTEERPAKQARGKNKNQSACLHIQSLLPSACACLVVAKSLQHVAWHAHPDMCALLVISANYPTWPHQWSRYGVKVRHTIFQPYQTPDGSETLILSFPLDQNADRRRLAIDCLQTASHPTSRVMRHPANRTHPCCHNLPTISAGVATPIFWERTHHGSLAHSKPVVGKGLPGPQQQLVVACYNAVNGMLLQAPPHPS